MSLVEGTNEGAGLRAWLRQWPDGLIGLDQHCCVCFISAAAEKMLGWSEHHAYGRHVHELLCVHSREFEHPPGDCPLCQGQIDPTAVTSCFWLGSDGYSISVDYRLLTLAGFTEATRVLSFQRNEGRVHNRQETEGLLAYIEGSPSPIAEFDVNGQVIFGNAAFHEAFLKADFDDNGQSRILPHNLRTLCHDCLLSNRSSTGHEVVSKEHWISWHLAPVATAQGRAVVGYAFDITERKRLELQGEQDKARVRRDFYAKMVHELRTPLSAIVGFSQMLSERLAGAVHARDAASIRAIRSAGLQLDQMIVNTLDIAKIEAGKMSVESDDFWVREMLVSVSEQLEELALAKGLTYEVECASNVLMRSDIEKVRQIVVNLLYNAIKYTHRGRIAVSVAADQASGAVEFVISDTGIGIAAEHVDDLYVAFSRVRAPNTRHIQGTGLGLALVAEFVEMLRGSISVSTELDKGTVFTVSLPVSI